jgi:hypothetical protein
VDFGCVGSDLLGSGNGQDGGGEGNLREHDEMLIDIQ